MAPFSKAGIAVILVVLFAVVALIQQHLAMQSVEYDPETDMAPALPGVPGPLPRLVNLKTESCIQCKRMIPILAELEQQFAGQFVTYTFDIDKAPQAGMSFGAIRILPTLIFFDQAGRELYRFEGYMSKAEILSRWRHLGVTL